MLAWLMQKLEWLVLSQYTKSAAMGESKQVTRHDSWVDAAAA